MPFETRETVVDNSSPHVGGRIDRLVQELAGGTRDHVTGLFDHDCVQFNGATIAETGKRLIAGDRVVVRYEVGRRYHTKPKPRVHRGFSIVHEDTDIIVVEKDAELLTVPTLRNEPYTLIYRVNEYVSRTKRGKGAFAVHRLDRGVSGLLVMGKTKEIADSIRDQFAARKPERKYFAIVAGEVKQESGTFRSYLATDSALNRYSTEDEEVGQYAVTHYRVVDRLFKATLVEVWLETGRRNQIRVHFSEADHPVIGDQRYHAQKARHRHWPYRRIALHAQSLSIMHPNTGEVLKFTSHLPNEMTTFINANRIWDRSRDAESSEATPQPASQTPEAKPQGKPKRPRRR